MTVASALAAMTSAKHATAVNVAMPQPVTRIANTDVTNAATAASSAFGPPAAPGTATKPAVAANPHAIRFNASPAIRLRYTRHATTAANIAITPANAAAAAVSPP